MNTLISNFFRTMSRGSHRAWIHLPLLGLFYMGISISGCSAPEVIEDGGSEVGCQVAATCQGDLALYCPGSPQETSEVCSESGRVCERGVGCVLCTPQASVCDGKQLMQCSADGQVLTPLMECPDICEQGQCTSACQREADARSYQGCEYWPTPLSNGVGLGFSFAVGVVNVNDQPTAVRVTRAGQSVAERSIAPGALDVITLPWVDELTAETNTDLDGLHFSRSVLNGAYHLTSDLPIIVYQFNPLEYRRDGDCPDETDPDPTDNACYSYSNDASLLLPAHAMGREYIALSYPTLTLRDSASGGMGSTPSSFQVVATRRDQTEVTITFSADSAASLDGAFPQYQAGETATFSLSQGEVLQIVGAPIMSCDNPSPARQGLEHCEVGARGDLSGSIINASQPVEVFGSHVCAFVPYDVFACDHLEESIFPLASWGRNVVVPAIKPLIDEPSVVKITSGADNNAISFSPPSAHPTVTLNKGESINFESRESFVTSGTGILQVTQFLVGQNYSSGAESNFDGYGDPSMSLIPPSSQFRSNYKVLAPESYALHYINLVSQAGASITLDGMPVPAGSPIPGTPWARQTIEIEGGVHELNGDEPFGVWVYGFGNYTSYMYPGGLDLKVITDIQ